MVDVLEIVVIIVVQVPVMMVVIPTVNQTVKTVHAEQLVQPVP